jgi:hypothetical protein
MRTVASDLPGGELVAQGLHDLRAGRESDAALVVALAATRLRELGFDVPASADRSGEPPNHRLYSLLALTDPDPYSRYNALLRRLHSFLRAAEHETVG